MKICLVTTFPPSRGGLSEYGFHIASELQQNPFLSLTVLADECGGKELERDGFSVDRCWSFNDSKTPARLLSAIRRHQPDVVWFNLLFTTFGHNPFVAFCGLATPLLTRLAPLLLFTAYLLAACGQGAPQQAAPPCSSRARSGRTSGAT